MRDKIHILSIDGGGMYGVVAAEFCKAIEKKLGFIKDHFDLMAGTSTGSILIGAFAKGLTAEKVQDLYFEIGPKIFRKPSGKFLGLFRRNPKYKGRYLREAIQEHLGKDTLLNEISHPLLSISAYNMSEGRTHYFRSWKDTHITLSDAVVASSSAPTYHPMHQVGTGCYTDGGVFAVNPSTGALTDALQQLEWKDKKIVLVSLGTGCWHKQEKCDSDLRSKGEIWWARNLPGAFLDGQDESIDDMMSALSERVDWLEYYRFDVFLEEPKRSDEDKHEVLRVAIDKTVNDLDTDLARKFEVMISSLRGQPV